MHLKDEAISVQGLKGWSREEEIPQRGGGICPRVVAADLSPTPQSEQGVEEVQDEDRRSASLVNNGFLQEKEMDMWHVAAGDPYPMEKNPNEVPMFARFVERGLALPMSDFFLGSPQVLRYRVLELEP
jgi:hypothetical protein